jgi:hypothetical protein
MLHALVPLITLRAAFHLRGCKCRYSAVIRPMRCRPRPHSHSHACHAANERQRQVPKSDPAADGAAHVGAHTGPHSHVQAHVQSQRLCLRPGKQQWQWGSGDRDRGRGSSEALVRLGYLALVVVVLPADRGEFGCILLVQTDLQLVHGCSQHMLLARQRTVHADRAEGPVNGEHAPASG